MDESDTRVDNDWEPLPWMDPNSTREVRMGASISFDRVARVRPARFSAGCPIGIIYLSIRTRPITIKLDGERKKKNGGSIKSFRSLLLRADTNLIVEWFCV